MNKMTEAQILRGRRSKALTGLHAGANDGRAGVASLEAVAQGDLESLMWRAAVHLGARKPELASELIDIGLPRCPDLQSRSALARIGVECAMEAGDFPRYFAMTRERFAQYNIHPHLPEWLGQDVAGCTVIVWCGYLGFGDYIMYARFIPDLVSRGARVLVQCPSVLKRLFETIPGVAGCHDVEELLEAHYAVKVSDLPSSLAYDEDAVRRPRDLFQVESRALEGDAFKVGIAWGAYWTSPAMDRTCALAELFPLTTVPEARLYSLQKGPFARQLDRPPQGMDVTDLLSDARDFLDTAQVIAGLDAVVSTDNVIANLAASLGVRTFVLLPYAADARWNGEKGSAWYPNVRCYQQQVHGEWTEPIERLVRDLETVVARRSTPETRGSMGTRPRPHPQVLRLS